MMDGVQPHTSCVYRRRGYIAPTYRLLTASLELPTSTGLANRKLGQLDNQARDLSLPCAHLCADVSSPTCRITVTRVTVRTSPLWQHPQPSPLIWGHRTLPSARRGSVHRAFAHYRLSACEIVDRRKPLPRYRPIMDGVGVKLRTLKAFSSDTYI